MRFGSKNELIEKHWRVDCKGFEMKCDECDFVLDLVNEGDSHECVTQLLINRQEK